jgi:hypothetical protein
VQFCGGSSFLVKPTGEDRRRYLGRGDQRTLAGETAFSNPRMIMKAVFDSNAE